VASTPPGGGAAGAAGPRPPAGGGVPGASQDIIGTRPPPGGGAPAAPAGGGISGASQDIIGTRPPPGGGAPVAPAGGGISGASQDIIGTRPPPGGGAPGAAQDVVTSQRPGAGSIAPGASAAAPSPVCAGDLVPQGEKVTVVLQPGFGDIPPAIGQYTDGVALLDDVLDDGVKGAANAAGIDVPEIAAGIIYDAIATGKYVNAADINEAVLVAVAKKLGLVHGLPGAVHDATSTLLQNLYMALGRGSKADLGPQVQALLTAIKGQFSSFDEFLNTARKAFETADDGSVGVAQIFTELDLKLLQAAYQSGGRMAAIESLLGSAQTAALRGVTAAQLAADELAAAAARLAARKAAQAAADEAAAAAADLAAPGIGPEKLLTVGGKETFNIVKRGLIGRGSTTALLPADAPPGSPEFNARRAIEDAVVSANPYIQQAGGIQYVMERFEAIRRYNNHSFGRFIRDSAIQYFTSPVQFYADFTMGTQALAEWEKLILGKTDQISGLGTAFGDALHALRSIVQALDQAGLKSPTSFLGGEADAALAQLIRDLDACWDSATPEYRAANAERYNQLRANLVKQRQDLQALVAQLNDLLKGITTAIKAIEALQTGPGGERRSGIGFFDPLVFIRLSQISAVVQTLGGAATRPGNGPIAEVVQPNPAATPGGAQPAQTVTLTYSIGSGPAQQMVVRIDGPSGVAQNSAPATNGPVSINPSALTQPPVIGTPGGNPIVVDPALGGPAAPAQQGIPPKFIVLPIDPKLLQQGGFTIDPAIFDAVAPGYERTNGSVGAAISPATANDIGSLRAAIADMGQTAQQAAGACDRPAFQAAIFDGSALRQYSADHASAWIPNATASLAAIQPAVGAGGPAGNAFAGLAGANGLPNLVAQVRNACDKNKDAQQSIRNYTESLVTAQAWAGVSVYADTVLRNLINTAPACVKPTDAPPEPVSLPPGSTTFFIPLVGDPVTDVPSTPSPGDALVSTATCRQPGYNVFGAGGFPSMLPRKPLAVSHSCSLGTPAVAQRILQTVSGRFTFDPAIATMQPIPGLEIDGQQVCVTDIPVFEPVAAAADTCAGDTELPPITGDGYLEWDAFRIVQQPKPTAGDPLFGSRGSWGQAFDDQWALKRIGYGQDGPRLPIGSGSARVVVAVIDSGIDLSHPDLAGMIWHNPRERPFSRRDNDRNGYAGDYRGWNFVDRNGDVRDRHGHGTFVAGLIAARVNNGIGIAGVNPWARIMPLKVVDVDGHTRSSRISEAVVYAVNNGARVINVSLGGKSVSRVEKAAFDLARARGVLVVTAAGNLGLDTAQFGPAGVPGALTVAATDTNDGRAPFSNWGAAVAVAAPGVDVLSLRAARTDMLLYEQKDYRPGTAFVGQDKRYYRATGTSFSAPLVAGLSSLLIARDPTLTNQQVTNIIKSTARDVGTPGVDQFTGYGLVDVRAALRAPRDYLLLAGIDRVEVVKKGNAQAVRVHGIAGANAFKAARLEIGAGETPTTWKQVATVKNAGEAATALGDIPVNALAGSKVWQIRVIVTHSNGATREARFRLSLG
jgi:subtilisin family serine protease